MRLVESLNRGLKAKKEKQKEIVKDIIVGEGDNIQKWRVTVPIDHGKKKNVKN